MIDHNHSSDQKTSPSWGVLRNRNLRLLWLGGTISVLGDQFYLIALPWLVLQLTGDSLAIGTVLALAGIPRAIFMLVGGALVDRFSPRKLMLWSDIMRAILVGMLAVLVISGQVELWMIYLLSLLFGLVDAFFYPAQGAIVPQVVTGEALQTANSLIHGTAQLSVFLGPMLAGGLIALLSGSAESLSFIGDAAHHSAPDLVGIGVAFFVDALTFVVSALFLWLMRLEKSADMANASDEDSVWMNIKTGFRYVWQDMTLRSFFLMITALTFLINAPLSVGGPLLADTRWAQGAAALGIVMSSWGFGSLIGTILAAFLPRPTRYLGINLLGSFALMGLGVLVLGLAPSTTIAAITTLIMGITEGYILILFITWLQKRTPDDMMGRMMGLLMMASIGLSPISNILIGALLRTHLTGVFVGAGILMALLMLLMATRREIREMGVL